MAKTLPFALCVHCLRGQDTAFALCFHCLRGYDTALALRTFRWRAPARAPGDQLGCIPTATFQSARRIRSFRRRLSSNRFVCSCSSLSHRATIAKPLLVRSPKPLNNTLHRDTLLVAADRIFAGLDNAPAVPVPAADLDHMDGLPWLIERYYGGGGLSATASAAEEESPSQYEKECGLIIENAKRQLGRFFPKDVLRPVVVFDVDGTALETAADMIGTYKAMAKATAGRVKPGRRISTFYPTSCAAKCAGLQRRTDREMIVVGGCFIAEQAGPIRAVHPGVGPPLDHEGRFRRGPAGEHRRRQSEERREQRVQEKAERIAERRRGGSEHEREKRRDTPRMFSRFPNVPRRLAHQHASNNKEPAITPAGCFVCR